ncbi:MAG: metallophosphoesterase family protein [Deltaproteobacteria bacterium]|nr:metallophosphoesterase family protein [Deltaproteobacteria bacterium]
MFYALPWLLLLAGCTSGAVILEDDTGLDDTGLDDTGLDDTGLDDTGTEPPDFVCGLLANGDAESGDTVGWQVEEGDWQAVGYAETLYPVPYEGGWQFFAGQTSNSQVTQSAEVTPWAEEVDEGTLVAHLSAQVRDWDGDDQVGMGLRARDASGAMLAEVAVGTFDNAVWQERRAHLALPPNTRSVEVTLEATRTRGTDNDGYFDAVDLCLDTNPAPEMTGLRRGPWLNHLTSDGVSVLWETQGNAVGAVDYGTTLSFGDAVSEAMADDHHEVRLTGLAADTAYRYRLRSDGLPGETFSFRTAPDAPVPFAFAVWGDNQNGPEVFGEILDRMEAVEPAFALAVGDLVQSGTEDNYRNQLLEPLGWFTAEVPFQVALGNHARYSDDDASLFDLHFAQPGDEHCFVWTYAGAAFLFLDSTLDVTVGSPQHTCVAEILTSPAYQGADLQMALFHYPARIEFWEGWFYDDALPYDGDEEVRDTLEPLFVAAGVDLVFNGHNHLYAYTPPGAYSSVAWVTTGGGGGAIDTDDWRTATWEGIHTTLFEHHFLSVSVDGTQIEVQAIGVLGDELHTFTITGD